MTILSILPENAVMENNGDLRTTSLKVAEAFGKRHDNLLRSLSSIDCSPEFNALNFEEVNFIDQRGQFRKAYQMTKDGFMFLVMGFTGKRAAQIKEAYINAFNQMTNHFQPAISQQQPQLTTFSRLPNHYDSGWMPAHYQRCQAESHWTYHIKFEIRSVGDKYSAKFNFGVGGKGKTEPNFTTGGSSDMNSGDFFVYRDLDELWENVRTILRKYHTHSPF